MNEQKKAPRRNVKAVIIIALVLVAGIATGIGLVASGALNGLFAGKHSLPAAHSIEGRATALRLEAAPATYNESSLREYYESALDYAAGAGFDTVLFEAKTGFAVQWRDKTFPPPEGVKEQDSLFTKLDPLAILLEAAEGRNIQIWLEVDPFSAEGYTGDEKGKAAKYLGKGGTAGDSSYTDLVTDSLNALVENYPVAGVVFTGVQERGGFVDAMRASWQHNGFTTQALIAAHSSAEAMEAAQYADGVLISMAAAPGYSETLDRLDGSTTLYLQPEGDDSTLLLFTANAMHSFGGAVLGSWPGEQAAYDIALLKSAYRSVEGIQPTGHTIPQTLAVTNPADGTSVADTQSAYYIMGTSDPALPLTVNGETVAQTAKGLWGYLVALDYGENTVSISQGGESIGFTIKRKSPSPGGGGGGTPTVYTTESAKGTFVRVTNIVTTALTDAGNVNSVNEIFFEGATAPVESVLLGNGSPVAYKLTSGDYLRASVVETANGVGELGTISARSVEGGEYIDFSGNATPAAYLAYHKDSSSLSLTFYGTSVTVPEGFSSEYVSSARVENIDGGVVLWLSLKPVWGYQLDYTENGTQLFLKRVPTASTDGSLPLAGITVMLDPGHGGDDPGASGGVIGHAAQESGPVEKELGLVLAQATAYRLRQLGAEVLFTREDDTGSHSTERLVMLREAKPDFFISMHRNAVELYNDASKSSGTEVYYFNIYEVANSPGFAENLTNSISNLTGRYNRGAKWSYFNVTLTSVCPAVLAEYGFVGNPNEYDGMLSTEDVYTEAEATVQAILATLRGETIANATE